jgi:NADH dehydrogenase
LNNTLSYAQAFLMELLPIKLMSRDNIRSMEVDSVSQHPFPALFGVEPAALEAVIPEYLVDLTQRGAYDRFRSSATR